MGLMNLICESIESPRDFYEVFSQLKKVVLLNHVTVKRSLSSKEKLRKRILSGKDRSSNVLLCILFMLCVLFMYFIVNYSPFVKSL